MKSLSFFVMLFALFTLFLTAAALNDHPQQYDYGIMIDCGSSGTRTFLYQWPARIKSNNNNNNNKFHNNNNNAVSQPTTRPEWSFKVDIPISTYNTPERAEHIGRDVFAPALFWAKRQLSRIGISSPAELQAIPIFVGATAGLRLLPRAQRMTIITTTRAYLLQQKDFKFVAHYAKILSGEEEGMFAFLAGNYLAGTMLTDHAADHVLGVVELGGASAQIAFVSEDGDDVLGGHEVYTDPFNNRYDFYTVSFLGYGQDVMQRTLHNHVAEVGVTAFDEEVLLLNSTSSAPSNTANNRSNTDSNTGIEQQDETNGPSTEQEQEEQEDEESSSSSASDDYHVIVNVTHPCLHTGQRMSYVHTQLQREVLFHGSFNYTECRELMDTFLNKPTSPTKTTTQSLSSPLSTSPDISTDVTSQEELSAIVSLVERMMVKQEEATPQTIQLQQSSTPPSFTPTQNNNNNNENNNNSKNTNCQYESCSINGLYQPQLPVDTEFLFVAAFAYAVEGVDLTRKLQNTPQQLAHEQTMQITQDNVDMLKQLKHYHYNDVVALTASVCNASWEDHVTTYSPYMSSKWLGSRCIVMMYIEAILRVLHFDELPPNRPTLLFESHLNHTEVTWTLGRMLYESNNIPYREVADALWGDEEGKEKYRTNYFMLVGLPLLIACSLALWLYKKAANGEKHGLIA